MASFVVAIASGVSSGETVSSIESISFAEFASSAELTFSELSAVSFFGKLSFLQRLKRYVILYRAKLILDSNRKIEKNNPNSLRFFLRHGGPLKKCTKYLKTLGQIDCTLSLSDALKEIDYANMSSSIGKLENFLVLGFPANDRIFEDVGDRLASHF